MDLLAWESLVLQSTGSYTTICHKISRSVFQLHGLLWLSNNTSLWKNRWCAGPDQQPRETNGRVSPNIRSFFPFPGSMQRMALSLYHFHRYFFWPDVLDGLKEMFTRTQFVCDQGGYFPEIKVFRLLFLDLEYMSCNSFLKSGTSWEIHHEATSRVPWLAEDAKTEREVLVRDNRWNAQSCFSERHDD